MNELRRIIPACWPYSPDSIINYVYSYIQSANGTTASSPRNGFNLPLSKLHFWMDATINIFWGVASDAHAKVVHYIGTTGFTLLAVYFFVLLILATVREFVIIWKKVS